MHKKNVDSTLLGTSSFICQNATTTTAMFMNIVKSTPWTFIQSVSLATEPGISLIILPLLRILERNVKQIYLIV